MNIYEATKILGITGDVTPEITKKAYRLACSKYHPDRNPGGLEMMKLVNAAYDFLKDVTDSVKHDQAQYGDELMSVINALWDRDGLALEICGSWLWISGDTKTHKDVLKALKCKWAPKKSMWYFRPADYKSYGRGKASIDEIRATYGSKSVKGSTNNRISVYA